MLMNILSSASHSFLSLTLGAMIALTKTMFCAGWSLKRKNSELEKSLNLLPSFFNSPCLEFYLTN